MNAVNNAIDVNDLRYYYMAAAVKGCELSGAAIAAYSMIVYQAGYGLLLNKSDLARRTGIASSSIGRCLDELGSLELIGYSKGSPLIFNNQPTPEVWANCFKRNPKFNEQTDKPIREYITHRTFIRNSESEMSFNHCRVWSVLYSLSLSDGENEGRESTVQSTNCTGIAVMTLLDRRTVGRLLVELGEMGLILVFPFDDSQRIRVVMKALTPKTSNFFSLKSGNTWSGANSAYDHYLRTGDKLTAEQLANLNEPTQEPQTKEPCTFDVFYDQWAADGWPMDEDYGGNPTPAELRGTVEPDNYTSIIETLSHGGP